LLVADFEESTPEGFEILRGEVELVKDEEGCPAGKGYLKIKVPDNERTATQVLFKLPEKPALQNYGTLSAHINLPPLDGEWKLRWHVLDKDQNQIYQRMFRMEGGKDWVKAECSLSLWRWSNSRVGDWSEARYLVLNLETGSGTIRLDDVRFKPGNSGKLSSVAKPEWVAKVAFADKFRSLNDKGFFIATDALDVLSEADLKAVLEKAAPIYDWIKSVFKKAHRPVANGKPFSLLIFKDMEGYRGFYEKLGKEWNVSIGAPGAGGWRRSAPRRARGWRRFHRPCGRGP